MTTKEEVDQMIRDYNESARVIEEMCKAKLEDKE